METKEKIKNRILKNIAKIWGFKDTELETSFDPLVGLLIGAISNELEKISDEIHSSQARILERLAKLLTPDILTGSKPAHSVLHARAAEPKLIINPEYQFYLNKKITSAINSNKEVNKEVFFSPSSSYTLVNGDIEYLVIGNHFHKYINSYQKEVLFESERGKNGDPLTLWLGIELDRGIESLSNLSFYFDLVNEIEKQSFLLNLPIAKWYIDGSELETIQGIYNPAQQNIKQSQQLANEIDLTNKIENFISSFYHPFFITIVDNASDKSKDKIKRKKYPEELEGVFSTKDLEKLEKDLVWINISFPSSVSPKTLPDVTCSLNCFPVINRKLNRFTYRLQENLNILPMSNEDIFLDVKSVYSVDGTLFESKPLNNYNSLNNGSYMLRQGGVGRFDSRNASEMIMHLIDLLRDESAAFTSLGNDFITTEIKELNQIIAAIEQKASTDMQNKEAVSFLMIKSRGQNENIFVEYWTTNGILANNLRPGTRLELYFGGDIKPESIFFVKSSSGGRDKLSNADSLNVYKETVLNRGRVITKEDIRSVCFSQLGKSLHDVKVQKGVATSSKAKNGLIRTIDVKLTPSMEDRHAKEEWSRMCHELEVIITNQSTGVNTYRVMLAE